MKEKGRWMDGSIDGETHREKLIDREREIERERQREKERERETEREGGDQ